jgi:beta-glucoside operon transcriptional antiterminator
LEYEYPDLTAISKWFLAQINKNLNVHLPASEVTSITMHFLNAVEGTTPSHRMQDKIYEICTDITAIMEEYFGTAIDQQSFHYFRFKNHIKYLVIRKERGTISENNEEDLYIEMQKKYPQIMECVTKINQYLTDLFHQECSHEELLYLMIHINQLYCKEKDSQNTLSTEDQSS